jgi:transposase InsO family protein
VSFTIIAAEKAHYPVRALCRALDVSASGFYAWRVRAPSTRAETDRRLTSCLGIVHAESRQTYGHPRLQLALQYGMVPSVSRVGDCWDNAPVESFFSNLKGRTRAAAESAIADHIAFYNRRRLHSAPGYRSPVAYEADLAVAL